MIGGVNAWLLALGVGVGIGFGVGHDRQSIGDVSSLQFFSPARRCVARGARGEFGNELSVASQWPLSDRNGEESCPVKNFQLDGILDSERGIRRLLAGFFRGTPSSRRAGNDPFRRRSRLGRYGFDRAQIRRMPRLVDSRVLRIFRVIQAGRFRLGDSAIEGKTRNAPPYR